MTWLLWRQHRNQAAIAALALAGFAIVVAITGVRMASDYHVALRSCAATQSCASAGDGLFSGDGAIIDLVGLTAAVPLLIGLFWGAPLLGREIEEGTHQLVWTQSVTRRRWLAGKTTAILLASTVVGVALSVGATWWSRTFDLIDHNRFQPSHFDIIGIVPIAYALFGGALGLACGALLRRTLPALATTLGVMVAARVLIANYVRPHYMGAVTKLASLTAADAGIGGSSWTLHSHIVDRSGANVADQGNLLAIMPDACRRLIGSGKRPIFACLDAHGYRTKIVYQPASRFWAFQGIESAIFVTLAIALVASAFVLVGRDA